MTVKKPKAAKSDSRSKKRSHTASPSSSVSVDDRKFVTSDGLIGDIVQSVSTDNVSPYLEGLEDTSVVEPMSDTIIFSDEPTLTEIIIDKYDGEKVGGRFEGFGIAYFVNGNKFEGNFSEGTMHGSGKFEWASENTIYEGDFSYNEITGRGKYIWSDGSSYVGDVLRGIRNGNGIYYHPSGKSYSGCWMDGKRNGMGIMTYDIKGDSCYEGEWNNNVIQGVGFRQYRSGNKYEGEWYLGKRHGHGTMKWLDRNEQYTGQWKNGIQNGNGQHIWFVQRIKSSQYSLRNIYEGEFLNGKRHGYGVFIYPSGARYEGQWVNNIKCGHGAFIFKNGRIYEGEFEDDRIKEFPNISISGRDSPDIRIEKVQQSIQDDVDNLSARVSVCSFNTISPSFQLYFDHLLMDPQITNPEEEMIQIQKAVFAQLAPLRKIYQFYSSLGDQTSSIDNTTVMNQMQFWRFLKDCRIHFDQGPTLASIDRLLAASANANTPDYIHNPSSRIIFLSFINYIVTIAHFIFAASYNYEEVYGCLLATCFNDLIQKNILVYSCNVGGLFYSNIRKTEEVLTHFNNLYIIFKEFCISRKEYPFDNSMRLRDFLIILKKLNLINHELTSTEIVRILSLDDPNVRDEQFVCLENEMTFYEFYEALIHCATVFITKAIINEHINPKSSSTKSTIRSDNLDDSETENSLTVSRSVTSDSKHDFDTDERHNLKSKPLSGKTKFSSIDSGNLKSKKLDTDKSVARKVQKSPKIQRNSNNRSRKTSIDRDGNARRSSVLPNESGEKVFNVAEVTDPEKELNKEISMRRDSDVTEVTQEYNVEREFNFWTHQIHLFFCQYFFPAAEKYIYISKKIVEKELIKKEEVEQEEVYTEQSNYDGIQENSHVRMESAILEN